METRMRSSLVEIALWRAVRVGGPEWVQLDYERGGRGTVMRRGPGPVVY